MVALKGINKVMSQGTLGLNPVAINRYWSQLSPSGFFKSEPSSSSFIHLYVSRLVSLSLQDSFRDQI